MNFHFIVTPANMINILIIAIGIGICEMSILQIMFGTKFQKQVKTYFLLFFEALLFYITNHLFRMLLEGFPGDVISVLIHLVTAVEFIASGVMGWLFSLLIIYAAKTGKAEKTFSWIVHALLGIHTVIILVSQFTDFCYYFDEMNVYHRSGTYIFSNLAIMFMLFVDIILLFHYRKNISKRVKLAFWIYIILPLLAIVIQSFTNDVQLIILATVISANFLAGVITGDLLEKYEKQQEKSSRIETELNMATDIQASQLPRLFPAFPQRDEFDIYAQMVPAKEVGGDFYDFFLVDEDHMVLVMADVSGKGVPAALFMMISRVLIKTHMQNGESPGETLRKVNDQLCEGNETNLFVTVWLAVVEISTGKGIATNAGHEHPAICRADGKFELITYRHSPAVATMEGINFKEHEFKLSPGDSLFVYTDGVAEATNSKNVLFGTERMLNTLNRNPGVSPKGVILNVMDGINEFVGDAEQFDDITMLCMKYYGPQ